MDSNGVFWIKPYSLEAIRKYDDLSNCIGEFITKTNYRSFSADCGLVPSPNKKCFAKILGKKGPLFYRGFIESVNTADETCQVRLMDVGRACTVKFFDIYPHRRVDDLLGLHANEHKDTSFLKCKYLAIRCCLSAQVKSFSHKSTNLFYNTTFTSPRSTFPFELVEQVRIGSVKCWVAYLYVKGQPINNRIVNCELHNQPKDKFKVIKEHLRVQNSGAQSSSPNPSLSEQASSLSNREWLDIETRQLDVVGGDKRRPYKRASSLNEYNETDKSEAEEVAKTFHGQQIDKDKDKARNVNFQRPFDGEEKKSKRKENRRRSKSVENSKKRIQQQQMLMQQENAHSLNECATDSYHRNEVSSRMRSDQLNNYYAEQQNWVIIKFIIFISYG